MKFSNVLNQTSKTLLLAAALTPAVIVQANDVIWTGNAGDGLWGSVSNWSTNALPGTGDNAILGANVSSGAVTMNTNAGVGTVVFGGDATSSIGITLTTTGRLVQGITVDASNQYDNSISARQYILGGNHGFTGTYDLVIDNASSHILTVGTELSMSRAGAAGATMNVRLNGVGTSVLNSNINQMTSETSGPSTLNIEKNDAGTSILNGVRTYNGTTVVNGGTLVINGTHTGGAAYSVASGGLLAGNGTVTTAGDAGLTLEAGATFAPGSATGLSDSTGTLTLNFGTGALDISAAVAGGDTAAIRYTVGDSTDLIVLGTGTTFNIGSGELEFADFDFTVDGVLAEGTYVLVETSGTGTIVGDLGENVSGLLAEGLMGTLAITTDGNTGFDSMVLTVAAIPEPSTMGMAFLGLVLLVGVLRRRR
ncbi:MAG: PEP-CTERM sorting domain-containing protein [Verrucomicrobiota bacterium JB024]|nr:PEP-CTERM sorting domain-containing protein [Verrucomicrobiota bacterium JB024]